RVLLLIFGEGLGRMPHFPVVNVAHALRVRVVFEVGTGRTGPVWPCGVVLGDDFGQNAVEDFFVVVPELRRKILLPAPVLPSGLDLVVAAPDDDARMIPQTLDVIRGLRADAIEKSLIARIHAAREHELLPKEDARLVAQLIEVVRLVYA